MEEITLSSYPIPQRSCLHTRDGPNSTPCSIWGKDWRVNVQNWENSWVYHHSQWASAVLPFQSLAGRFIPKLSSSILQSFQIFPSKKHMPQIIKMIKSLYSLPRRDCRANCWTVPQQSAIRIYREWWTAPVRSNGEPLKVRASSLDAL